MKFTPNIVEDLFVVLTIFILERRSAKNGRDIMGSYSFLLLLLASCIITLRGIPLNVILLIWLSICNSKEVDNV